MLPIFHQMEPGPDMGLSEKELESATRVLATVQVSARHAVTRCGGGNSATLFIVQPEMHCMHNTRTHTHTHTTASQHSDGRVCLVQLKWTAGDPTVREGITEGLPLRGMLANVNHLH